MKQRQMQALFSENKILLNKLHSLQERIDQTEERLKSSGDCHYDSVPAITDSVIAGTAFGEPEEESIEMQGKCVHATEEILGISVLHYSRSQVSPHEGLTGRCYEINMNLVILGTLKVVLNVVEREMEDHFKVLSTQVAVSESSPAHGELSSLVRQFCGEEGLNQQLFLSLREYAQKAASRKKVLKEFRRQYGTHFHIETADEGIVIQWPRVFHMAWSVQWDEDIERVVDSINFELSVQAGVHFIKSCESTLKEMTEPSTSPEARLVCLKEIASRAIRC